MGDRGNIVIDGVWLYTHLGGFHIKIDLQKALQRHLRWDDSAYLTRIIFDQMKGNDFGETGFGISTKMCDNEHNILRVDCDNQTIDELKYDYTDKELDDMNVVNSWSFEEFVRAKFNENAEGDEDD